MIAVTIATDPAFADVTMSKDGVEHETPVALAAVRLGKALQVDDRKELADATKVMATAISAYSTWLQGHPRERSDATNRIETAAKKLAATADKLRTELEQQADPGLIHQTAIDGLHRYNEFIDAHQGDPPRPEIAIPDDLREAFLVMNERIGREVQGAKPNCDDIGHAVLAHVDDDLAILRRLQAIDEAQPQDQREALRAKTDQRGAQRMATALKAQAPLRACRSNATVRAYFDRTDL